MTIFFISIEDAMYLVEPKNNAAKHLTKISSTRKTIGIDEIKESEEDEE